jgi:hypothetical protein
MRQRKSDEENLHEKCIGCRHFQTCIVKHQKLGAQKRNCFDIALHELSKLIKANGKKIEENGRMLDELYPEILQQKTIENLRIAEELNKEAAERDQRTSKKLTEWAHRKNPTTSTAKNITLPPIVKEYTYDEFVEYAFDPETDDKAARKAKTALKRETKREELVRFGTFSVPVYPATGKIVYRDPELGLDGSSWHVGRTEISYNEFMSIAFDSGSTEEITEQADDYIQRGLDMMDQKGWGWQKFTFWKNNYNGRVSITYQKIK